MRLIKTLPLIVVGILALAVPSALAAGECCTRGSLAVAGMPESTWSLDLLYDYSSMKTILDGTTEVTPDEVLDDKLMHGAMKYSVPTKMVMQKYVLAAQYKPADSWRVTATLPYLVNDMDMRMAMQSGAGMPMKSNTTMDTVQGLGDATLGALYTLVAPAKGAAGWDMALGLGLKLPTGKNDVNTRRHRKNGPRHDAARFRLLGPDLHDPGRPRRGEVLAAPQRHLPPGDHRRRGVRIRRHDQRRCRCALPRRERPCASGSA